SRETGGGVMRRPPMKEGDVLIVARVRPGEPVPKGFKLSKPTPTHHDRFAKPAVKLIQAKRGRASGSRGK
ncbi:MAG: hypothetical protein NBV67_02455, partial [Tagaea sp.]|nr:hypothetical protein [Tagaea sp.]